MKRKQYLLCLCVLFLYQGQGVRAALPETGRVDLAALEALTGHWIALRSQLAEEEQTWQRQQQQWAREIALLEQEITTRKQTLARDTDFLLGVEQAQADTQEQQEMLDLALRDLGVVVGRHELLLQEWAGRIPESLQSALETGFRALPANDVSATRVGVLRRLQTVLALYTQIETLQNNIHLVRELVAFNGSRRAAEILYLGLARGFAVSANDDWAAIGWPDEAGWRWQEAPAEAAHIRLAIRVLARDAEAQLVPLLLQIPTGEQP